MMLKLTFFLTSNVRTRSRRFILWVTLLNWIQWKIDICFDLSHFLYSVIITTSKVWGFLKAYTRDNVISLFIMGHWLLILPIIILRDSVSDRFWMVNWSIFKIWGNHHTGWWSLYFLTFEQDFNLAFWLVGCRP